MRRWIVLAARLYPRAWRAEFEEEFRAVLDDVKPSWRVFANVMRGAIEMQMVNGRNWAKVIAAIAIAGAIAGVGFSYRVTPMYVSSATIQVTPVIDPSRPAPAEVLRKRAMQQVGEIQLELLRRAELSTIINDPWRPLYQWELRKEPLEDVIDGMRSNIRITINPSTKGDPAVTLSVSYSYPRAPEAKATASALVSKFLDLNQRQGRYLNDAYRDFWRDMASVEHLKSVPPAPAGEIADVVAVASVPVRAEPNRFVFLAWGFATGTLLGFLTVFVARRPRQSGIAVFAAAGCVTAFAVSFLIPNRYTSTTIMRLAPAVLTENPLASPGAPASNAEFLRRVTPEILSAQNLTGIIEDPRLELYRGERASKSMEEAVEEMRANLNITPVARDSGFSISFTYYDRFKAQQTVSTMMARFIELNQEMQRAAVPGMNFRQRAITERKAGEVLDVLDVASLPIDPVSPNRWLLAAAGLCIGALIGAITFRFRKPGMPAIAGDEGASAAPGRGQADRPYLRLLQIKVDGVDYGFRAG